MKYIELSGSSIKEICDSLNERHLKSALGAEQCDSGVHTHKYHF